VNDALDEDRLWDQYGRLLDEYRFQVDLNWKRSQYFFVLNVALLVAAVSLLSAESARRGMVAAVFGAGVLLAVISILANYLQHAYYRAAREAKRRIENRLGLDEFAIATTPGMRAAGVGGESRLQRVTRVRHALTAMLAALAIIDVAGIVVALA
jgi:hypothetical protein